MNASSINQTKHSGAVLAEFMIGALFLLVPLALLVPLLAKYIEGRHYMEQSARYAAWERTAWYQKAPKYVRKMNRIRGRDYSAVKSNLQIEHEIKNRVLSEKTVSFHNKQASDKTNEKISPMLHVQDHNNRGKLVSFFEEKGVRSGNKNDKRLVGNSTTDNKPQGNLGNFDNLMTRLLNYGKNFELNVKGQYNANVSARITNLKKYEQLGLKDLSINANNVLLAESWQGGGPSYVQNAVKDLLPAVELLKKARFDRAVKLLKWVPIGKEFKDFDFGKVTVEPVPCVRLADRRNRTPYHCRRRPY